MSMCIKCEFTAGTSIEDACSEMIRVARTIGVSLSANFNGVELYATRHGSPDILASAFRRELKLKGERPSYYAMAVS